MKRLQSYRFRLMPRPGVERSFRRFAGCCRYVYNRGLSEQNARRERGEKRLNYAGLCKALTGWKREEASSWLQESPSSPLQQALKNLDRAYTNFFEKRASCPVFKKKRKSVDSFRFADPNRFAVDAANGRIKLPKVGWVRYRNSRLVEGTPKQVAVTRRNGKWFVCIQTEREVPDPVHPNPASSVGVDLGIANLVTLSSGQRFAPLNADRSVAQRLTRLQRQLDRKVKFSANWRKQKARISKLHATVANRRSDHLHKISATLSKNHATVAVEDLQVKNMSASAKGTVDSPGRHVRQKSGLNRSIRDQGWGELIRQLAYKCQWTGGKLVRINPANTSRTCSSCGYCDQANRKSQSRFMCLACGLLSHADVNAAKNILAEGHAATARGGVAEVAAKSNHLKRPR